MGMAMGGYCFFLAGLTLGDPKTLNKKELSFFDNGRIKKSSRRISSGIISPKNLWSQVFGPLRPPHDGLQGPHLLEFLLGSPRSLGMKKTSQELVTFWAPRLGPHPGTYNSASIGTLYSPCFRCVWGFLFFVIFAWF